MKDTDYDIIIVGGSYAGLSAAMTLGRAIRKVLVIDSGKPCNQQTPHSHNFLTQDGATPAEIAVIAKKQVFAYPTVSLEQDVVTKLTGSNHDFSVATQSGREFSAKKILFATGVKDLMPEIPGFSESWGISVIHCPYCHGYEYRGQNTGILANDDMAFEFVKLIDNWTKKLTLFTNGKPTFDPEQIKKIRNPHFHVVEKEIKALIHEDGYLREILFTNESRHPLDALYARVPFVQHSDLPIKAGCRLNEAGYISVDEFKRTSVPGIYAAGDNTAAFRTVSMVTAAGTMAGAAINKDMIDDQYLI